MAFMGILLVNLIFGILSGVFFFGRSLSCHRTHYPGKV